MCVKTSGYFVCLFVCLFTKVTVSQTSLSRHSALLFRELTRSFCDKHVELTQYPCSVSYTHLTLPTNAEV